MDGAACPCGGRLRFAKLAFTDPPSKFKISVRVDDKRRANVYEVSRHFGVRWHN